MEPDGSDIPPVSDGGDGNKRNDPRVKSCPAEPGGTPNLQGFVEIATKNGVEGDGGGIGGGGHPPLGPAPPPIKPVPPTAGELVVVGKPPIKPVPVAAPVTSAGSGARGGAATASHPPEAPKLKYRHVGKSGMQVSNIALGNHDLTSSQQRKI